MEKMNDIDFIKRCVPFADFLEITEYGGDDIEIQIIRESGKKQTFTDMGDFMNHYAYSHFLTRVIEGLPKIIRVSKHYIEIGDRDDPEYGRRVSDFENIDACKKISNRICIKEFPVASLTCG